MNKLIAGPIGALPDREWWDNWLYSVRVYTILCLTFGAPMAALYLAIVLVF